LLSPQQHYDWGLRALKTILNSGGQILLNEKKVNKKVDVDHEAKILIQALRINTLSKLTFADSKRFNALCEDIWPALNVTDVAYAQLEAAIQETLTEMKLDVISSQVKKILQFYEACNQRMGVVIVGPGKKF
jgi:dynein heavy chain 2